MQLHETVAAPVTMLNRVGAVDLSEKRYVMFCFQRQKIAYPWNCISTVGFPHKNKSGGNMKYRKKPVVIEAYQTNKEMIIHTLEGDMKANVGDYIITGVNGEQYPCKPDIFEKTYEPVE